MKEIKLVPRRLTTAGAKKIGCPWLAGSTVWCGPLKKTADGETFQHVFYQAARLASVTGYGATPDVRPLPPLN